MPLTTSLTVLVIVMFFAVPATVPVTSLLWAMILSNSIRVDGCLRALLQRVLGQDDVELVALDDDAAAGRAEAVDQVGRQHVGHDPGDRGPEAGSAELVL